MIETGTDGVLDEVARAVGLQEGVAGVERVLRAFRELGSASTRAVGRLSGLPVPIAAAVSNELRRHGLVTTDRPGRLTARGLEALGDTPVDVVLDPLCACCHGHGVAVPPGLDGLEAELEEVAAAGPAVDLTLDQSHCTAATKLRRVLLMLRYRLLPAPSLLAVGDDDLVTVAVAAVGAWLGRPLVGRLAVIDIDAAILDYVREKATAFGVPVETVRQDLREPLDARLTGRADVAMTDPPYTVEGAELFLRRCVEGLKPGPGRGVVLSFGARAPQDAFGTQEALVALGLTVRAMHRDFNAYHGAGVIGGSSDLQVLETTGAPLGTSKPYAGPLYTAEKRAADRAYRCLDCGARHLVGPGGRWPTVAALKEAACPDCGGRRFRPLQLVRADQS